MCALFDLANGGCKDVQDGVAECAEIDFLETTMGTTVGIAIVR
jgi:hypothetical protein